MIITANIASVRNGRPTACWPRNGVHVTSPKTATQVGTLVQPATGHPRHDQFAGDAGTGPNQLNLIPAVITFLFVANQQPVIRWNCGTVVSFNNENNSGAFQPGHDSLICIRRCPRSASQAGGRKSRRNHCALIQAPQSQSAACYSRIVGWYAHSTDRDRPPFRSMSATPTSDPTAMFLIGAMSEQESGSRAGAVRQRQREHQRSGSR